MRASERKLKRISQFCITASVICFDLYAVWGLVAREQLQNLRIWAIYGLCSAVLLVCSYSIFRRAFRAFVTYTVICFLLVTPIYLASTVAIEHNVAQSLASSTKKGYFRDVLGRHYNYTELVQWVHQALTWNNSTDMIVYSDPIEIYEYGQARCGGYAVLYAALSISQGYECRIVISMFRDHAWNEVKINGSWTRVDASPTGAPMNENVGYPLFYEEKWNAPPILALAFDGSSITDVTSCYRSDHWSLWSLSTVIFGLIGAWFAICIRLLGASMV